jgi:3-hydroxyisobutyrate dehydrogenase-like beta-hydroxyacid dehydrogenase
MSESATNPAPVSVLGLGLMGQALAGAFLTAGHPTTVWNRSAHKADALVARGATLAASAGEAIQASPLVVVCLTDYDAVRGLLDPLEKELGGRVLVNLTSGTSQQARETAAWADRRGATYLDGVILALPQVIGTPEAVLIYSGPRPAFDEHEVTLRALTPTTVHLGADHALSSLYDMASLSVMWGVLNGFLQGVAVLETAKVKAAEFAPFANQLIGTMKDWLIAYAAQIDSGEYPAADATIATHLAAMEHLVEESETLGVNSEFPRLVKAFGARAVASGRGEAGYAALIEHFREPAEGATR